MSYQGPAFLEPVCGPCAAKRATGDVVEFRSSSLVPWLLFGGLLYVVLKTPDTHEALGRTARAEGGRAYHGTRRVVERYSRRK